jgi:hypothetical protein
MLALVFLTAVVVSACVLMTFAMAMDAVLFRLISGEMAKAWSLYAKFAVFVASFVGGLRLQEIQAATVPVVVSGQQQASVNISASKCLVEVFKTIAGALSVASWTLFAFFGAALAAYVVLHVYNSLKSEARQSRGTEQHQHSGAAAGHF